MLRLRKEPAEKPIVSEPRKKPKTQRQPTAEHPVTVKEKSIAEVFTSAIDKKKRKEKTVTKVESNGANANSENEEKFVEEVEAKQKKKEEPVTPETNRNTSIVTCSKKNANGKSFNLKITSWNVSGVRAWLKKDGLSSMQREQPDLFCIQETKCSKTKLPQEIREVDGYFSYWCASKKEGYAGVGVLSKIQPLNVIYGIDHEAHDEEGRCITLEFDTFHVVNVYVPNAGQGLKTLPKRLDWNVLFKSFVKGLDEKKPVILCGDMNVAHAEIDLANPKTNKKHAGFTQEERNGMTDFLQDGYVDSFRFLYPDVRDVYTFWSYMGKARAKNVGWRLDYFIVSERLKQKVCDSTVASDVYGSDHCPINLFISV